MPIELVDTNTPEEILASHSVADMTVREHMAVESMKAVVANPFFDMSEAGMRAVLQMPETEALVYQKHFPRYIARLAVQQADALLSELVASQVE